jgi:hypothetical protein
VPEEKEQPKTAPAEQTPAPAPAPEAPAATPAAEATPEGAVSPAPTDVAGPTKEGEDGAAPATPAAGVEAEPLSDGTVPTVLTTGQAHVGKVKAGHASITSIYRRADIVTTLITLAGGIVASAVIIGAYVYFTKTDTKTPTAPKVTTLDKAELEKLGAFFTGNSAGRSSEILNINSSSLFKGRVAVDSDFKVTGGVEVTGPTALGALTVDKVATLGITNIRGQLSVDGPTTLRGAAILAAGGSVNGNLTVTGNGSFGGSLSAGVVNATNLTVSGTLNIAGHLSITGPNPSTAPATGAGSGAASQVEGNDSAGTVTITTGTIPGTINAGGDLLVSVTFKAAYGRVPKVIITPVGANSGGLDYYTQKTATGFTIGTANNPRSNTAYSFDYWVIQ